jgi:hypothetical protein
MYLKTPPGVAYIRERVYAVRLTTNLAGGRVCI